MRRLLFVFVLFVGLFVGCEQSQPASAATSSENVVPTSTVMNVWCFSAGKADAFLFWNSEGAVLIDTGESGFGKTVLEKLRELGIEKLEYLIVTHFDKDHVGGAKKILSEIQVDTVLQSNCPKSGAEAYEKYVSALKTAGIEPVTVRESLSFSMGETVFTVNPPARDSYPEDDSNNSSLIVTVTHGKTRLLFCGAAEDLRLTEYLETKPGNFALVKLPHHGRYQKTLAALLDVSQPDYAVITSSEEEPEDAETLTLLADRGVEALLTRNGAIWIKLTPEGMEADYAE